MLLPALALLTAVLAYIGVYVWRAASPPATAAAETYLWRDCVSLSGLVLRTEQTVTSPCRGLRVTAVSGRRVAAGEVLGVAYDSAADYFRAALLLRLRGELAVRTGSGGGSDRREFAAAFTRALARGDLNALALAAAGLSPRPAELGDAQVLTAEIRSLERAGAEEGVLTAPASGFFLPAADGLEALSPAMAETLTYAQLSAAARGSARPDPGSGRLVTGSGWAFAALTDPQTAGRFAPGDTVALSLAGETVDAQVLRADIQPLGAVVLLRCDTGLQPVLDIRLVTAEAEFSRLEGLLLPPEAVHAGGEETFVYRSAGELVRQEAVTVLAELPEGVLVESEGLRPGDTVLLDAQDTF